MAESLEQLPGRLDLRMTGGRPFTYTVACTGATISSPTFTQRKGSGDAITVGAPTVNVSGSGTITVAWSAADTAALLALSPKTGLDIVYDLAAYVNGDGPHSLLASKRAKVEPLGVTTSGTQSTSASLTFEIGQAEVALAVTLSGGSDGSTVLNGSGAPDSGDGEDGDFYIDTTAWDIYGPKATTWPSGVSLVGPAGSNGAAGATGATGATGAAGATGPAGPANVANYLYLFDNYT